MYLEGHLSIYALYKNKISQLKIHMGKLLIFLVGIS